MNFLNSDFSPSIDCLIKTRQCEDAIEELFCFGNQVIRKEVYLNWLAKHSLHYESVEDRPLNYGPDAIDRFLCLYNDLTRVEECLSYEPLAKTAIDEYSSLSLDNETKLLEWLVKYEELDNNTSGFFSLVVDEKHEEPNSFVIKGVKVDSFDFNSLIEFRSRFQEHYWTALEKYNIYTSADLELIGESTEAQNNYHSLTYHLNKRGLIL